MRIAIDASDLAGLQSAFAQAPEIAQEELRRFMRAAVIHLTGEVQERTPTTHGTLRASIGGNVRALPNGIGVEGVVGTSLAYAIPVELGTKPHMPPIEPLKDWVRQKFGLSGKQAERAAWGVARAIARRGTLGVGMFHRSFAANRQQIIDGFGLAVRRMLARIAEQAR